MIGEMVVVRLTAPLNPLVPLMVIVKIAEEPFLIFWPVGVAVMVKLGAAVTVIATVVEWDIDPLVAVTVAE